MFHCQQHQFCSLILRKANQITAPFYHRQYIHKINRNVVRNMTIIPSTELIGLKQLIDTESSTYTYIILDIRTKYAIIIDPVDIQVQRDIK